eukprot:503471-Pelagomonas_calceolata.AAC.1
MADRTLEPPLNGPLLMEQADAAYKILGEAQLAGRQAGRQPGFGPGMQRGPEGAAECMAGPGFHCQCA